MGMFRMMCRSVPFCRRQSSVLWTLLVVALIIYIVYSHIHPRNKLTQLLVDKLPAGEKDGFWGNGNKAIGHGDRIQHGPFPGERWPHNAHNIRLGVGTNGPITPAIPHEARIDRKFLLDKQWDSNERQNQRDEYQWRNRGDRQGFANQDDQRRAGFDGRFNNRFGNNRDAFQRGGDSRFHDNANAFPRRGDANWNNQRLRTADPRGQDSFRLNNQGRWAEQDSREKDNARRGWVDRNRVRHPGEERVGDDVQNREDEEQNRKQDEGQVQDRDHAQDQDRDQDQDQDRDQDQDQDQDRDQDQDQDRDQAQDQDRDQAQDQDRDQDQDQNRDEDQDQDQDQDRDQDHGQDQDRDQDHGQDQDRDQDKKQDEDEKQDENPKLKDLEHKGHKERLAILQNAFIKAGKLPGKAQSQEREDHDQVNKQDENPKLKDLEHIGHKERLAILQNAFNKASNISREKQALGGDERQGQDKDYINQDDKDRAARIQNVLRGPPDLQKVLERPVHGVPPVANEEKEELPELDLNKDEVKKRRNEFENRGGPESVQKGPGLVDAPPPNRLTLQSLDLGKLEETFHRYVLTKQVSCQLIARAGRKTHGGWNFCITLETRPKSPCLIYSFGMNTDYTFEDDVAKKYNCETHYFDPTLNTFLNGIKRSTGVTMHKYGLSDKNGFVPSHNWFVKTLATIKKELRHPQPIDILKIDIEENEWRSIPEMLNSGVMGHVRQLLIEFHILAKARHPPTEADYMNHLQTLRDLYIDGFRIAAVRQDDTKLPSMDGMTRAQNYEMLFLRNDSY